ncbi:hypothetical protein IHE33_07080 [Mycetohabitans endofungorum]|uniref:hypothetical protein n=1 Tax=Mycetohabitans endofungorum TaxID=417203 RepID=UPI0030CD8267
MADFEQFISPLDSVMVLIVALIQYFCHQTEPEGYRSDLRQTTEGAHSNAD